MGNQPLSHGFAPSSTKASGPAPLLSIPVIKKAVAEDSQPANSRQ